MNYDDLDHLDSLISEDYISEEEDCVVSSDYSATDSHHLGYMDQLNPASKSIQCTPEEDDIEIDPPDSPKITCESDSSQTSVPSKVHPKAVELNSKLIKKVNVSSLNNVVTPSAESSKNESVTRILKLPSNRAILPSNSLLVDSTLAEDYSMLENKINDSLLDVLQGKITKALPNTVKNYQSVEQQDETLKFINIFPSKSVGKTINLMVKGKTCRSKQLLNATEMRIVSRIVNQENTFGRKSRFYKNVYYDPESDTNIRYEVYRRSLIELNPSPSTMILVSKKANPKYSIRNGNVKIVSDKGKLTQNKITKPLLDRISRPARYVISDSKQLKHISELYNQVDENKNTGIYSDCETDEDLDLSDDNGGRESEKLNFYGRLEPSKRQFSSLATCPTCNGVYPGYRRMAIHFQKFPGHKDEEILKQLLMERKEEIKYCSELGDKRLLNTGNKESRSNNTSQTSSSNQKSKLNSKLLPRRLRNPAVYIKELVSRFGTKEFAKHAGPVITEEMNSWEYLLMRGKKLKSGDGALLISLLKELKVILAQIQAMSSNAFEPVTKNNQHSSNKLTIGPKDVLQHVLGVQPGMYVISDSNQLPGTSSTGRQNPSLSRVNPEKPQSLVQSTDNTTAKLFDAVVAECLRDESSDMDSNTTQLNQKIDPKSQNVPVLVFENAVANGESISTNEVPIITTNNLPVSTQLLVPQTVQPVNNADVNSPILLDFNIFDETPSSNPQISRHASELGSTSLAGNDLGAPNQPEVSNVALSLPLLTDNITDDSREPYLPNDILDFSFLD